MNLALKNWVICLVMCIWFSKDVKETQLHRLLHVGVVCGKSGAIWLVWPCNAAIWRWCFTGSCSSALRLNCCFGWPSGKEGNEEKKNHMRRDRGWHAGSSVRGGTSGDVWEHELGAEKPRQCVRITKPSYCFALFCRSIMCSARTRIALSYLPRKNLCRLSFFLVLRLCRALRPLNPCFHLSSHPYMFSGIEWHPCQPGFCIFVFV